MKNKDATRYLARENPPKNAVGISNKDEKQIKPPYTQKDRENLR